MSTKIYNGFQICGLSPRELFDEFTRMSKELNVIANREFSQAIADRYINQHDNNLISLKPETVTLRSVQHEFADRQREVEKSGRRDPMVDWGVELSFAPMLMPENQWIGIAFTENDEFLKFFTSQRWYVEFGYWNNSDQPEEISDVEWEMREKIWDKYLSTGIPRKHMASITLVDNADLNFDLALATMPSDQDRINTLIETMTWRDYQKLHVNEDDKSTSSWFGAFLDFSKAYKPDNDLWATREPHVQPMTELIALHPIDQLFGV